MWSKLMAIGVLLLAPVLGLKAQVAVGQVFPALRAEDLVGTVPATENKVVLVDFCASWCTPCKQSFPVLSRLQAAYADRGLVVVGVSVDAKTKDYETVLKKWKPGFAVVHDAAQRLVAQVKVATMPTSYLLDRQGVVRFVHTGFHGATASELEAQVQQLLAE